MFGFEKLDVWQKTIDLADDVYRCTREFPDDEKFGLASQMRRATGSISSKIAEGSGRASGRDFRRFIEISYGSLMELVSRLPIAQRQSFIPTEAARDLDLKADEMVRMLSDLRSSLRIKENSPLLSTLNPQLSTPS